MTGVGAEGWWSSVTVQLFPRSPTSVFAHSTCLCTQVASAEGIYLASQGEHMLPHPSAHVLCCSSPARTRRSLSADVCLHPFIWVSDKLLSSSLSPITLDALSSPALQLHSKEQSKITSHFLSFMCSFLYWVFLGLFFHFFHLEQSHFVNAWKQKILQTQEP